MRLTYKYEKSSGYGSARLKNLPNEPFVDKLPYRDDAWQEQRNKLGQLEDIEEELGIDLVTLFRALKDGVYMNTKMFDFVKEEHPKIVHYKNGWRILVKGSVFQFKTYGKTWALTKEELEK